MIALPKQLIESDDESPHQTLFFGSQTISHDSPGKADTIHENACISEWVAAKTAQGQQEFAMLQRAMIHCGLIDIKQNDNRK